MTRLKRLLPQLVALAIILVANSLLSQGFLDVSFQNGRFYGSLVESWSAARPSACSPSA
mgnify:CR=1 FL=1